MIKRATPSIIAAFVAATVFGFVLLISEAAGQSADVVDDGEPIPAALLVDAGPETGAAAEVPGPAVEHHSTSTDPVAVPVPDAVEDPLGFFERVYQAYQGGEGWVVIAGILLIGFASFWMWVAAKVHDWFDTTRGKIATLFLSSLLMGAGLAAMAGESPDGKTLVAVLTAAAVAIGGRHGFRRFIWPKENA